MREIVRACEFSNWERFTNHAGRALGIIMVMLQAGGNDTIIVRQSRHKGPNSMTPYKRNTKIMESDLQDNLMGSYLF
jgi:ribosomal 30S subunit maturation factor RimM